MKPVTLKIDTQNRYRNELWINGQLVAHGNDGLEGAELKLLNNGKRMVAVLTLTSVNVIVQNTECPEKHRYSEIQRRFGNREELNKLNLVCDMLKMSPTACDGCPYRPKSYGKEAGQSVKARSSVTTGVTG